jgi:hypothetical protein
MYPLLESILVEDRRAYEALYADSRLMIDASVGYFFYIDEVVSRLQAEGERPKVVVLFREPLGRAASFFNELRKKGMDSAPTLEESLRRERPPHLWWEYYYDNVPYAELWRKVQGTLGDVMAVNYDAFAKDPAQVTGQIAEFVGVPRRAAVDYRPMNSSAAAVVSRYANAAPWASKILPRPFKRAVIQTIHRLRRSAPDGSELEEFFPYSLSQYSEFTSLIGGKDIYYVAGDQTQ